MKSLFTYSVPSEWCIGVRGDINNNSDNVYEASGLQKSKSVKDASNLLDGCSNLNVHAKEFSLERSKTAPQSIINVKPEWVLHIYLYI